MPHDVNEGLGSGGGGGRRGGFGGFGGGGVDLDPLVAIDDETKPLRSKLLAVPALRARYLSHVRDIAERHLRWETMLPAIRQYQQLIAADVKADTRKLYSTAEFSDLSSLQDFVERRRARLLR